MARPRSHPREPGATVTAVAGDPGAALQRRRAPGDPGALFVPSATRPYLLVVLSSKRVEEVRMSPRAVIVYTLPAEKDTAVRLSAFVVTPA